MRAPDLYLSTLGVHMKDKLALLIFAWGGCTPTPNTAEEIAQVLLHTNLCWKKKKNRTTSKEEE